jgi:hypothetical protein
MAAKQYYSKEEKIKREMARLNRVFKGLDKNKLATVQSLIKMAAFNAVSLDELQETINQDGYTQKYKNGANQHGIKQSAEAELYIQMTRNQNTIIKQLADITPPLVDANNELMQFRKKHGK